MATQTYPARTISDKNNELDDCGRSSATSMLLQHGYIRALNSHHHHHYSRLNGGGTEYTCIHVCAGKQLRTQNFTWSGINLQIFVGERLEKTSS